MNVRAVITLTLILSLGFLNSCASSRSRSDSVEASDASVEGSGGEEDLDEAPNAETDADANADLDQAEQTNPSDSDLGRDARDPPTPTNSAQKSTQNSAMPAMATNRYQVMQNAFDRAHLMPMVNDFDSLDDPSPRLRCVSVKAANPDFLSEVVIKQMRVQVAGAPDYGPLFPGSLDHSEMRLVIGKNNGWVNSQNLSNEIRQVFDLARAPGSLVIRINPNRFGIYQDIGAPAEVWIRKDQHNRLYFKVYRLTPEKVRNEVFIGYCFLRGVSALSVSGNQK